MKIKKGYILRENVVGNDNKVGIVIAVDSSIKNLNGYIQLNETGIFIWRLLENGATKDEIVSEILKVYEGAPLEVVKNDVDKVIKTLENIGAIDEWYFYWTRS